MYLRVVVILLQCDSVVCLLVSISVMVVMTVLAWTKRTLKYESEAKDYKSTSGNTSLLLPSVAAGILCVRQGYEPGCHLAHGARWRLGDCFGLWLSLMQSPYSPFFITCLSNFPPRRNPLPILLSLRFFFSVTHLIVSFVSLVCLALHARHTVSQ